MVCFGVLGYKGRHADSNRGPAVYETAALPLSHVGKISLLFTIYYLLFTLLLYPRTGQNATEYLSVLDDSIGFQFGQLDTD